MESQFAEFFSADSGGNCSRIMNFGVTRQFLFQSGESLSAAQRRIFPIMGVWHDSTRAERADSKVRVDERDAALVPAARARLQGSHENLGADRSRRG